MTSFQVGFAFGGICEAVKIGRLAFSRRRGRIKETLWTIIVSVPGFLAFSFAAGVIIDWGIDKQSNHTLPFVGVLIVWALTQLIDAAIDHSCATEVTGPFGTKLRWRLIAVGFAYAFSLALCIWIYHLGSGETGLPISFGARSITAWIILSLIVYSLITGLFAVCLIYEERHGREILRDILSSFAAPQAPQFYGASVIDQLLAIIDGEQIIAGQKIVTRHRDEVRHFTLELNGKLHPGLEGLRISKARLTQLASEVRVEHIRICDLILRASDIIIAPDPKAAEGRAWIQEHAKELGFKAPDEVIGMLDEHRKRIGK